MSIDARIIGVQSGPAGTFLNMEPRERGAIAGQTRMEVLNPPDPPTLLNVLIGECVWGGDNCLMMGDTKIAERVGYTKLKLGADT